MGDGPTWCLAVTFIRDSLGRSRIFISPPEAMEKRRNRSVFSLQTRLRHLHTTLRS
jgi:hypothetical protein